jgi:hypothetical protein
MKLITCELEFKYWCSENIFYGDEADDPKEYPFFVRTEVKSWNYEEESAVYLYRADLVKMLEEMDSGKQEDKS